MHACTRNKTGWSSVVRSYLGCDLAVQKPGFDLLCYFMLFVVIGMKDVTACFLY